MDTIPELLEKFATAVENDDRDQAQRVLQSYVQRVQEIRVDEQQSAKRVETARNKLLSDRSALQDTHRLFPFRFRLSVARSTFLSRASVFLEDQALVSESDVVEAARDAKELEKESEQVLNEATAPVEDVTVPPALEVVLAGDIEFVQGGSESVAIQVLNAGDRTAENVTVTASAGDGLDVDLTPSVVGTLSAGERVETTASLSATSVGQYRVTVTATATENERAIGSFSVRVNQLPSASFTIVPAEPNEGQSVTLDASGSSDKNGTIQTFEWDVNDDGSWEKTGETVTHRFSTSGEHEVTLRVTDNDGATDTTTRTITVVEGVSAVYEVIPQPVEVGEKATFDASASTPESPANPITEYRWDFDDDGEIEAVTSDPVVTHTYDSAGEYAATLTVVTEDQDRATATRTRSGHLVTVTDDTARGEDEPAGGAADSDNPFPNGIPGVSDRPPQDLDGDGLYEDVNGDGTADFSDATALAFADFDAINAGSQAQIDALDFDGDGDVDFKDAVTLSFNI